MATDVTVGIDPSDQVIRVNFDSVETGRRAQAEMDEKAAEDLAAAILGGRRAFVRFNDTITGQPVGMDLTGSIAVANDLKAAASHLRAQKAGQIDLRGFKGQVPKT